MRVAKAIELTDEDRKTLERWHEPQHAGPAGAAGADRAHGHAGAQNLEIAGRLGTSPADRRAVAEPLPRQRLEGIAKDAPRGGRPPRQRRKVEARIVEATTQTRPPHATHWTTRTLAAELGSVTPWCNGCGRRTP